MRHDLARLMRKWADRISDETAPKAFPAYFTFEDGKGVVIHQTDGVRPNVPGCPLWYIGANEYARAHRTSK